MIAGLHKNSSVTAQKMKFYIKDFFSKWDQIRSFLGDLVTFIEEILNGKLHILCSECSVHVVSPLGMSRKLFKKPVIKPLDEAAHQWGFLLVVLANFQKTFFLWETFCQVRMKIFCLAFE